MTPNELIPLELSRANRAFLLPALAQIFVKVEALCAELRQPSMLREAGATGHIAAANDHLVQAMNELRGAINFLLEFKPPVEQ